MTTASCVRWNMTLFIRQEGDFKGETRNGVQYESIKSRSVNGDRARSSVNLSGRDESSYK